MELIAGQRVRIKVENVMYPYRDRYAPNVSSVKDEFNYYEGEILYEKWFKPNEVGITTGDPRFKFRRIQKERIVEIDGNESKFSAESLSVPKDSELTRISVKGSKGDLYEVEVGGGRGSSCSCKGYQFRGSCRHITEAEESIAA
jgi:hypothetical protein|tara:strand:+ start:239 stop:670 length:432 start_codon:yes stop_codon:yes gene_type:complete